MRLPEMFACSNVAHRAKDVQCAKTGEMRFAVYSSIDCNFMLTFRHEFDITRGLRGDCAATVNFCYYEPHHFAVLWTPVRFGFRAFNGRSWRFLVVLNYIYCMKSQATFIYCWPNAKPDKITL